EANSINAMAVPLTTGPCQGTNWSRNKGAMDAYRPNPPNARKGRQQVSTKAHDVLDCGQVSLGKASRQFRGALPVGIAPLGNFRRMSANKPRMPSTSVGIYVTTNGAGAHCPMMPPTKGPRPKPKAI